MKILNILMTITVAMLFSVAIGAALQVDPLPIMGGLSLLSFLIPKPMGALSVALLDLARPAGNNVGGGGGIDSEIILIPVENIDMTNFPSRSANGGSITGDIPLKAGKYMHRFYATQETLKPNMKKIKGSNKDSGGYEVSIEGFHPGWEQAILDWIASYGFSFQGFVIVQNCANSKRYLMGEPCNLITIDSIESSWGESVDKDKGSKVIFLGKQSQPVAIYSGVILYDSGSSSW